MNEVNVEAVAWAIKRSHTKLKAQTMYEYQQKFDRMMQCGVVPGTSKVPSTRLTQRAAARYALSQEILKANSVGDAKTVAALWMQVQQIKQIADGNVDAYEAGEFVGSSYKRNSKKASIKRLPDDWRSSICKLMLNHIHGDAVKVLACVGSRPAELESGIEVYRDEHGVHFTIQGAKVGENKGQLWRVITLPLDHPIAMTIVAGTYFADSLSITKAITRKAVRLGFEGVSAYSFRHQFCSDLKASGYAKKTIAKCMGHQSTTTQSTYGNSGAGRQLEVQISSATEPRIWVNGKSKPSKKPKIR
jgi:hypothetical protein